MAKKTKAQLQAELNAGKSIADVAAEQQVDSMAPTDPQAQVAESPAPAPIEEKQKAPGKIAQILAHFKAGKTTKEISQLPLLDENGNPVVAKDADGNDVVETFHPTTISIQVNKYKKANPDLYPPLPPAKTKKEIAAEKKAEKARLDAEKAANAPQPEKQEASAVAEAQA
jgi:hypothetical protein